MARINASCISICCCSIRCGAICCGWICCGSVCCASISCATKHSRCRASSTDCCDGCESLSAEGLHWCYSLWVALNNLWLRNHLLNDLWLRNHLVLDLLPKLHHSLAVLHRHPWDLLDHLPGLCHSILPDDFSCLDLWYLNWNRLLEHMRDFNHLFDNLSLPVRHLLLNDLNCGDRDLSDNIHHLYLWHLNRLFFLHHGGHLHKLLGDQNRDPWDLFGDLLVHVLQNWLWHLPDHFPGFNLGYFHDLLFINDMRHFNDLLHILDDWLWDLLFNNLYLHSWDLLENFTHLKLRHFNDLLLNFHLWHLDNSLYELNDRFRHLLFHLLNDIRWYLLHDLDILDGWHLYDTLLHSNLWHRHRPLNRLNHWLLDMLRHFLD